MEYLLKASVVIFIFYMCYKLFLQRETFFKSNRWFFLTGLLIALVLPFVVIPIYIEYTPVAHNFIVTDDSATVQTVATNSFNIISVMYTIYGVGLLFFLVKLGIELSSLLRLLKNSSKHKNGTYTCIETKNKVPPFSFFKHIVYNKNQFAGNELDHIINHEKAHARYYHSVDILFIQLASAVFWFNPFIWLYKKELQQNLEFIADKEAQTVSNCEKSYQTLLLKASLPNYQLALVNNFYNSLIKKRIVMLHKSKSKKLNVWKYALVLPVLAVFLMSASTEKIYVEKATPSKEAITTADPSLANELNSVLNATDKKEAVSKTSDGINGNKNKNKTLKKTLPNAGQSPKGIKAIADHDMVVIDKDFTDADLDKIKKQLKEKGITIKFKGIKRNDDNEITAIKIEVSSKKSNANYHTENGGPILPIKIGFNTEGGSLSIGNSGPRHSADNAYTVVSKDGKYKIHTVGKADNVFVVGGDDDDDHVEKIVISSSGKAHTIRSKGKGIWVTGNGNASSIAGEHIVVSESKTGDIDTIHVKKLHDGNTIWISKDDDNDDKVWVGKEDDDNVFEFDHGGDNKFFMSLDDGKEPLFMLNGKEISKKEMDELDPDSIEKIEVLNGDSATEKYGDKGKDGVVLITTKDKK